MKPTQSSLCVRFTCLRLIAVMLGTSACADVDPADLEQEVAASDASVMQEALQAQNVAGATAVATTVLAPFIGGGAGPSLAAQIDQAVKGLQTQLGSCVAVTPNIMPMTGSVAAQYTNCTGPFGSLSFSGSSSAEYTVNLTQATTSLVLVTDLSITVGADVVKAVSRMETDIDVAGQSAVVDTSLEITGPNGQPEVHTGKLDVAMSGDCVSATLGGDSPAQQAHFEIRDLSFCADGSACVQGITLEGADRKLVLDFPAGGGGSFSFTGPQLGAQQGTLPAGAEMCVDLL